MTRCLFALLVVGLSFLAPTTLQAADDELPFWTVRLTDRDCVELTDTEKLVDLNGAFTIEFWGKLGDEKDRYFLFQDESVGEFGAKTGKPTGYSFRCQDRRLDMIFAGRDEKWKDHETSPLTVKLTDKFHHIAISKAEERVRIFLDGKVVANKVIRDRFALCPSNLFLGVRHNAPKDFRTNITYRGFRISDAALYEKDFTPESVLTAEKTTLLLLDFRKTKEDKDKIRDVSGNGHDGVFDGATWVKLEAKDQPKK